MQISQHKAFKQRMLFNACKVYSRQLPVGGSYQDLQAVHCLSILNNVVEPDTEHFIHTYDISNKKGHLLDLEGIHLHCIELPKFRKNSKFDMTNPLHAWMKFFADPEYFSTMPIRQYETFEELKKAIELADESNFSQGQLYAYDRYLDNIRTQKAIEDYQKEMGIEMGIEIGRKEGMNITISIYKDLQRGILSYEDIAKKYAISLEEVLRGMTIWAAFASFQENKLGSLEKGKDATFVIFERKVQSQVKFQQNYSWMTFIKGLIVYDANEL
jgi:predicted transposase/invertase (TIGR01784 family)